MPSSNTCFGAALRREWLLEDGTAYLNHGSFGACPRRVLAAQERWRERMERQPVRFLDRELPGLLDRAAGHLAAFVGARARDLVFVDNATSAVNAVVGSVDLGPGDEVVVGSQAYPAVVRTLERARDLRGARLVVAEVPFPLEGPEQVVEAYRAVLGPRTRLVVVDHITSATAVIQPVGAVVELCRLHQVPVLVDGAHAPGQVALDLEALGADYYTGNAHKWLFAPKGCALLWARPERQPGLHSLVVSHGTRWREAFHWQGTRDPSAWLAVTEALSFVDELGVAAVQEHNRSLAEQAGCLLALAWGLDLPVPAAMRAAMCTLPAPGVNEGTPRAARALHDALWREHRIEVPVFGFAGRCWIRISAQVYNDLAQYQRLADALVPR